MLVGGKINKLAILIQFVDFFIRCLLRNRRILYSQLHEDYTFFFFFFFFSCKS